MKNKILKVVTIVIIIVLIILIILGINLTKKHLIIKDISKRLANYRKANNYYLEATPTDIENEIYYYYKLNNKEVEKRETNIIDDSIKYESYKLLGSSQRNMYIYQKDKNIAILNDKIEEVSFSNTFFNDIFKTTNKWNYIKFLLNVKITSQKYNGKECYCINVDNCLNTLTENVGGFLIEPNEVAYNFYIEKDTGLIIYNPFQQKKYEYKFDYVKENDVKEPNISEFEIEE